MGFAFPRRKLNLDIEMTSIIRHANVEIPEEETQFPSIQGFPPPPFG
jgi:hypothetical protein